MVLEPDAARLTPRNTTEKQVEPIRMKTTMVESRMVDS